VLLDEGGGIIAGHGRVLAAQQLGLADVPCMVAAGWSEAQKRAYIIADNKLALNAGWDEGLLRAELEGLKSLGFDIGLTGFSLDEIAAFDLGSEAGARSTAGTLAAKFMVPPFSVLNAREGWWQDRKRAWLALGIQSELGRGEGAGEGSHAFDCRHGLGTWQADHKAAHAIHAGKVGNGGLCDQVDAERKRRLATPGRALLPAADYSGRKRGDGRGLPIG
jgi:hypothetical protein